MELSEGDNLKHFLLEELNTKPQRFIKARVGRKDFRKSQGLSLSFEVFLLK